MTEPRESAIGRLCADAWSELRIRCGEDITAWNNAMVSAARVEHAALLAVAEAAEAYRQRKATAHDLDGALDAYRALQSKENSDVR